MKARNVEFKYFIVIHPLKNSVAILINSGLTNDQCCSTDIPTLSHILVKTPSNPKCMGMS